MNFKLLLLLTLITLLLPTGLFAAEFFPLVGIPGLDTYTGEGSLNLYINALYRLSISIAALLAVIKIVAAGAKYMLTDIVPAKEEAKKDIQGALIGLLIVISAIIILNTVNTDLTKLNLTVPVQEIKQGEATEKAIYDAVTAACDKPGRAAACVTLTCEAYYIGIDQFEKEPNEDEMQACRRTCSEDYKGAFDPKSFDPKSATCRYDPLIAQRCDPNNSWNCCTEINNGTWYTGHKKCENALQPFEENICYSGVLFQEEDVNCIQTKIACRNGGGTVISEVGKITDPNVDVGIYKKMYGSILCSDPIAATGVIVGNSIISNSSFKPSTQTYNADQLSQLSNQLGVSITNSNNIISINSIPWSAMVAAGYKTNPTSDELDKIATTLKSKCLGSKIAYKIGITNRNETQVDFYCLK